MSIAATVSLPFYLSALSRKLTLRGQGIGSRHTTKSNSCSRMKALPRDGRDWELIVVDDVANSLRFWLELLRSQMKRMIFEQKRPWAHFSKIPSSSVPLPADSFEYVFFLPVIPNWLEMRLNLRLIPLLNYRDPYPRSGYPLVAESWTETDSRVPNLSLLIQDLVGRAQFMRSIKTISSLP